MRFRNKPTPAPPVRRKDDPSLLSQFLAQVVRLIDIVEQHLQKEETTSTRNNKSISDDRLKPHKQGTDGMRKEDSPQEDQLHHVSDEGTKEDQPTFEALQKHYDFTGEMRQLHDARLDDETERRLADTGFLFWGKTHDMIIFRIFDLLFNSDIGHNFVEKYRRPNKADGLLKEIEAAQNMFPQKSFSMSTKPDVDGRAFGENIPIADAITPHKPNVVPPLPTENKLGIAVRTATLEKQVDAIFKDLHGLSVRIDQLDRNIIHHKQLQDNFVDEIAGKTNEVIEHLKDIGDTRIADLQETRKAHQINFQNIKNEVYRTSERLDVLEARLKLSPTNIQSEN